MVLGHVNNTDALINSLQLNIRRILDPLFPEHGRFILLDFPNHANVGDSAIWLGEMSYFRNTHNRFPAYVADTEYFVEDICRVALNGGTIFMHGGGNFGDLWPKFQHFREDIIRSFRDCKIVQLPQSIHFDDPKNVARSQDVINSHPDYTLLVRDHESLEFARKHYACKVDICPDLAFFLGRIARPVMSELYDAFCLMRTDKEKSVEVCDDLAAYDSRLSIQKEDWLDEPNHLFMRMRKSTIFHLPFLGLKAFDKNRQRELLYRRLASDRLKRGVARLSTGRVVITDRLHAHILSILLDIPHIRLDNSYGKISNFANAWTADSDICYSAQSFEEALEQIEDICA